MPVSDTENVPIQEKQKPQTHTRRDFFKRFLPDNKTYKEIQSQNPDLLPSERNALYKTIGRRNFLLRGLSTGFGVVGLGILAKFNADKTAVDIQNKNIQNSLATTSTKKQTTEQNTESSAKIFQIEKANIILNSIPGSPERKKAETDYTSEVINSYNLQYLDQAFWFITNTDNRIQLLEERWKMRESGSFGLKKLEKQEREFAKNNNFHPEWIAICKDSYLEAKNILQKKMNNLGKVNFIKEFRPDLEDLVDPKLISLEDIILPIGVLIGIAWNESKVTKNGKIYALANIGPLPAFDYSDAKDKFIDLSQFLSINSVKYNYKMMPGSNTGDIGSVQFRPDTAIEYNNFFQKHIGFRFNPYGLEAVTAACLMLSIGHKWKNEETKKDEYRYGFIQGGEKGGKIAQHQATALQRWNQKSVDSILDWNEKYTQTMK